MVGQNNVTTAKGPDCPPGFVCQLVSTGAAPAATLASLPKQGGKSDASSEVYDKTQLLGSIDALRNAMMEADTDLLKAHASPDLSFGHSNGYVQTLDEFAETIRSGEEVFKRVDLTGRNLKITGNTAVERHHFSADIVYKGELKVFELEIVQIWKKTDRWRLAVRQAYKT
jgi:hypothetical protein